MSTVPAPQPRSRPPSTTREQLDELDALLQRMLELPVDPASAPEEPDGPATVAEEPPREEVAEAPADGPPPAPAPVPEPSSPGPSPAGEAPAVDRTLVARNGTGSPPVPLPGGGEVVPGWAGPLVFVNRAFDRATRPLGVVGYWLRRPRGRAVLGWAGVALLALALCLVFCTWRGWF
jgi:hypothetical protein